MVGARRQRFDRASRRTSSFLPDPAPSSEQRVAGRERLDLAFDALSTIAPERRILLVPHEACEVPMGRD